MSFTVALSLLLVSFIFIEGKPLDGGKSPQRKLLRWAKFRDSTGQDVLVDLHPVMSAELLTSRTADVDSDKVHFYLYTEESTGDYTRVYTGDKEALFSAGYNTSYQTKIIVHGFLNDVNSDIIQSLKDNFFAANEEKYNVIGVDWSYYAKLYVEVVEKTEGVGALTGSFIDFLQKAGSSLDNLHCIGHSLGAHVCGFAGSAVSAGKIARISGLDPALPGFNPDKPQRRLDANDAKFVDCIHTCDNFLGMEEPICTADFYPNSGKNQPGCLWWIDLGVCSHSRSHELYAESILPGHLFPSLSCDSLDFSPGDCKDEGALMGYPATDRFTGIFYLETNSHYPYAKNWTGFASGP